MKADLKDQIFGYLTCLYPIEGKRSKDGRIFWKCRCQCGNTKEVTSHHLKSGNTTSCGCYNKKVISNDLAGRKFGRLTALQPTNKRSERCVIWECLCRCGKICEVSSQHLRSGGTNSCGCYNRERSFLANTKDITDQVFGYLTVKSPTTKRSGKSVVWECQCKCRNICEVSSKNLQAGATTSCGCRVTSKLYEDVKQSLLNLDIEIYAEEFPLPQKYFGFNDRTGILRVDLVVWSLNKKAGLIAIECQGRQHYEYIEGFWGGEEGYKQRLENDALKKACLKVMNIPLIEIRFDEPNIEEHLKKQFFLSLLFREINKERKYAVNKFTRICP